MTQYGRRRPGDRVVRHPRQQELEPIYVQTPERARRGNRFDSPFILMYFVGGLIAISTTLLWLPVSNTSGGFTPFLDALFTATSAVTVTGLVTLDTATYWNSFGQIVIFVMMLIGGLGFMSAATYLLIIITQRISPANQLIMREFLDVGHRTDAFRIMLQVIPAALIIQVVGFALLLPKFWSVFEPSDATWQAAFLSVSAFNNAGFNILPESNSLASFRTELWVLGITAVLIILGGIGYNVWRDAIRERRFNRFSLDTRLVLITSAGLWILGGVVLFASELTNPETLGQASFGTQLVDAFFQTISGRTAGFSTIDFSKTGQHTNVFYTGLMFIGGASSSVAGGIKVNTFAVIVVTVWAAIHGRSHVHTFGKELPEGQIHRALAVAFLAIVFIGTVSFMLTVTEKFAYQQLVFETVSAFGTVGLSTGITGELSPWGKTFIVIAMFVGRLGPLTMALSLGQRHREAIYRYSQERVRIG